MVRKTDKEKTLAVCIPSVDGNITGQTFITLTEALKECGLKYNIAVAKGSRLDRNINQLIAMSASYDYVLLCDTDMWIPKDAIKKMIAHDKDIITGLMFIKEPPYLPVIFKWGTTLINKDKFCYWFDYPKDELTQADAVGGAFMLIKREIFHKHKITMPYFKSDPDNKVGTGCDLYFCKKLNEFGIKIFVDTSIKIGHVGEHIVTEQTYLEYRAKVEHNARMLNHQAKIKKQHDKAKAMRKVGK